MQYSFGNFFFSQLLYHNNNNPAIILLFNAYSSLGIFWLTIIVWGRGWRRIGWVGWKRFGWGREWKRFGWGRGWRRIGWWTSQSFWQSFILARKQLLSVWLNLSVSPLDCGWYADVTRCWVLVSEKRLSYSLLQNSRLWSEIIMLGKPNRRSA